MKRARIVAALCLATGIMSTAVPAQALTGEANYTLTAEFVKVRFPYVQDQANNLLWDHTAVMEAQYYATANTYEFPGGSQPYRSIGMNDYFQSYTDDNSCTSSQVNSAGCGAMIGQSSLYPSGTGSVPWPKNITPAHDGWYNFSEFKTCKSAHPVTGQYVGSRITDVSGKVGCVGTDGWPSTTWQQQQNKITLTTHPGYSTSLAARFHSWEAYQAEYCNVSKSLPGYTASQLKALDQIMLLSGTSNNGSCEVVVHVTSKPQ
ncbi:hypothetical protein [Streptomyces sp. NPDC058701]|uniref:hypothetical protein n=1 Tax=Streptomyces sp. NPDC058701 TaxID=3346608 RepID=UPI00366A1D6E